MKTSSEIFNFLPSFRRFKQPSLSRWKPNKITRKYVAHTGILSTNIHIIFF